jgi:4-diphosphocytidyl-2-C-methyl-D-erythritol kinase
MRLGADVPVLLHGTRALVTGAGEHVEPLAGDPPRIVIVPLEGAALATADVYRAFDALGDHRSHEELERIAADLRAGAPPPPVNDLEPAARRLCPAIDRALEALITAGATDAMVTGSGPTVFGRASDPEAVAARVRTAGYPRAQAA